MKPVGSKKIDKKPWQSENSAKELKSCLINGLKFRVHRCSSFSYSHSLIDPFSLSSGQMFDLLFFLSLIAPYARYGKAYCNIFMLLCFYSLEVLSLGIINCDLLRRFWFQQLFVFFFLNHGLFLNFYDFFFNQLFFQKKREKGSFFASRWQCATGGKVRGTFAPPRIPKRTIRAATRLYNCSTRQSPDRRLIIY